MARSYSQDLRDKVLAAYDRGMKTKQIAEAFGVCTAWARGVRQRRREHGETSARKRGTPGVRKIDRERLAALVAEQPDATGPELRQRLGVECTDAAIYAVLKQLGLTYKKRRSMPPSRTARMSPGVDPSGKPSSPISTPNA